MEECRPPWDTSRCLEITSMSWCVSKQSPNARSATQEKLIDHVSLCCPNCTSFPCGLAKACALGTKEGFKVGGALATGVRHCRQNNLSSCCRGGSLGAVKESQARFKALQVSHLLRRKFHMILRAAQTRSQQEAQSHGHEGCIVCHLSSLHCQPLRVVRCTFCCVSNSINQFLH